jgi:hypothetical protein
MDEKTWQKAVKEAKKAGLTISGLFRKLMREAP